jgi:ferredoxin
MLAHIAHWLMTGSSVAPLEPSEAISFSRSKVITPGLIVLAVAVVSTLFVGRFFCGWACHLLAVQDGCAWLLRRMNIRIRPLRSRVLRLVPVAAFVWMFLVPMYARMAADVNIQHSAEWVTESFWKTFPGPTVSIITFLIAGCYVVYLLGNKAYCAYACPYGAIIGASDSFSVGRIVVDNEKCNSCMSCTKACSSNVIVHQEIKDFGAVVDSNCMKTLDCVAACPNQALSFQLSKPTVLRSPKTKTATGASPLPWADEALLACGFLFGFFATHDLFGAVSFLLALGFGLVAAYGGLYLKKMKKRVVRKKAKFAALLIGVLFFSHAATVQSQALLRDHYFDQSFSLRMAYLRGELTPPLKVESIYSLEEADTLASRVSAISYAGHERNDYIHGWHQLMSGDSKGFEQAMAKVLVARPGFGEVLFQLGIHYWITGQEDLAVATMQEIQVGDPKHHAAQEYIAKIGSHQLQH